jgi:hypothetical protein
LWLKIEDEDQQQLAEIVFFSVEHRLQRISVSLQLSFVKGMKQRNPVVSNRQMHQQIATFPTFFRTMFPVPFPQVGQVDPESLLLLLLPVMMMVWGAEGGAGGGG